MFEKWWVTVVEMGLATDLAHHHSKVILDVFDLQQGLSDGYSGFVHLSADFSTQSCRTFRLRMVTGMDYSWILLQTSLGPQSVSAVRNGQFLEITPVGLGTMAAMTVKLSVAFTAKAYSDDYPDSRLILRNVYADKEGQKEKQLGVAYHKGDEPVGIFPYPSVNVGGIQLQIRHRLGEKAYTNAKPTSVFKHRDGSQTSLFANASSIDFARFLLVFGDLGEVSALASNDTRVHLVTLPHLVDKLKPALKYATQCLNEIGRMIPPYKFQGDLYHIDIMFGQVRGFVGSLHDGVLFYDETMPAFAHFKMVEELCSVSAYQWIGGAWADTEHNYPMIESLSRYIGLLAMQNVFGEDEKEYFYYRLMEVRDMFHRRPGLSYEQRINDNNIAKWRTIHYSIGDAAFFSFVGKAVQDGTTQTITTNMLHVRLIIFPIMVCGLTGLFTDTFQPVTPNFQLSMVVDDKFTPILNCINIYSMHSIVPIFFRNTANGQIVAAHMTESVEAGMCTLASKCPFSVEPGLLSVQNFLPLPDLASYVPTDLDSGTDAFLARLEPETLVGALYDDARLADLGAYNRVLRQVLGDGVGAVPAGFAHVHDVAYHTARGAGQPASLAKLFDQVTLRIVKHHNSELLVNGLLAQDVAYWDAIRDERSAAVHQILVDFLDEFKQCTSFVEECNRVPVNLRRAVYSFAVQTGVDLSAYAQSVRSLAGSFADARQEKRNLDFYCQKTKCADWNEPQF